MPGGFGGKKEIVEPFPKYGPSAPKGEKLQDLSSEPPRSRARTEGSKKY